MKAEVLKQFCGKMLAGPIANYGKETLNEWVFSEQLPAKQLKALAIADFESIVNDFEKSFNVTIKHPAGIPYLEIVDGTCTKNLADAVANVHAISDATELNVEINVNKTRLVEKFGFNPDQAKYYLFKNNLLKVLGASLLQVDTLLFNSRLNPCLVIVSEEGAKFEGALLNIINENECLAFDPTKLNLSSDKQGKIEKFYSNDLYKPSWIGFNFTNLTPFHFGGKWESTSHEDFAKITNSQLQKLCVLFTANRSNLSGPDNFQSIYANSDRVVYLDLSEPVTVKSNETLNKLMDWISDGNDKDKLTIFQNVTARILNDSSSSENYRLLTSSLPKIFEETEWNYKLFVDGKITKHFEEVQKFRNSASETSKKVAENIDTVTKGVTDALLATIGVLIATVIAALVKNDATIKIFSISFTAYAIYLIIYGLYRMASIWHNYYLLSKDANEQKISYIPTLGSEKVTELITPVERRKFQFHLWFWITTAIYLALVTGILIAAGWLPNYLINNQIIEPKSAQKPKPEG